MENKEARGIGLDHARMRPLIRYIDASISKRIGGTMSYISDAKSRGVLRHCRRFPTALTATPDSLAISPVRDTSGSDLSVELKIVCIAKN